MLHVILNLWSHEATVKGKERDKEKTLKEEVSSLESWILPKTKRLRLEVGEINSRGIRVFLP